MKLMIKFVLLTLTPIRKWRTDKSWNENLSNNIFKARPPNLNGIFGSKTIDSTNLASKWIDGAEAKLSMANLEVVPWGKDRWIASTVVAIPNTNINGNVSWCSLKLAIKSCKASDENPSKFPEIFERGKKIGSKF